MDKGVEKRRKTGKLEFRILLSLQSNQTKSLTTNQNDLLQQTFFPIFSRIPTSLGFSIDSVFRGASASFPFLTRCCFDSEPMRCCCWSSIRSSIRDYDKIQSAAVQLIYIQIGCALIGSLGALYNGVLVINLVVALFALIAIENNSQSLGRTYAVLLACGISLDLVWFVLFSHAIWNISSEKYGPFFIFSVRLALGMQIIGFAVRLLSSLLWIQMYRLGASSVDTTIYRYADSDLRNSLLSPSSQVPVRQNSGSDEILGGSIYDPSYYSSLFEDAKDNRHAGGDNQSIGDDKSTPAAGTSPLKFCKNIFSRFRNGEHAASTP